MEAVGVDLKHDGLPGHRCIGSLFLGLPAVARSCSDPQQIDNLRSAAGRGIIRDGPQRRAQSADSFLIGTRVGRQYRSQA